MESIIWSLCLLSFLFYGGGGAAGSIIDSIYQFGASKSDTGNLILIDPNVAANRLPYGETYPGHPTGRWSDGRLIIDYTAMYTGLSLLEPYLKPNASFESGVNFAVAGATAINTSVLLANYGIIAQPVPDLSVQISWFREYLGSYCSTKPECRSKLRNSLIFFGEIGGNDINFGLAGHKTLRELHALVPGIIQAIVQGLKEVISLGASKIVVPGIYPIGCLSFVTSVLANDPSAVYDEFGCNVAANQLAVDQNKQLQYALGNLILMFPDVKITYLDFYNAFKNLLFEAPLNGFDKHTLVQACCGTGDYNTSSPRFCGGSGVPVCPNPNKYINWDGVHLTQAANARIFMSTRDYLKSSFQVAPLIT